MSQFNLPAPLSLEGNLSVNWRKFKQSFNIYMTASKYENESNKRQTAILLNLIGQEALELHNTFTYEQEDDVKDITKVLQKFEDYCNPKKNILHSRFLFYKRKQLEAESFDSFYTEVKKLVRDCEFKHEEEMLRDKVVLSSSDKETQDRIIKLGTITLNDAVENFRVAEIQKEQLKLMKTEAVAVIKRDQTSRQGPAPNMYNQYQRDRGRQYSRYDSSFRANSGANINSSKCPKCGFNHSYNGYCPAKGKKCNNCNRFDHFSYTCRTRVHEMTENESKVDKDDYFCESIKMFA